MHTHVQPSPSEVEEMAHRALLIMRLLQDLKRKHKTIHIRTAATVNPSSSSSALLSPTDPKRSPRAPKRPWEEDDHSHSKRLYAGSKHTSESDAARSATPPSSALQPNADQSAAEKDMEVIRSKRMTGSGGILHSSTSGTKNKYRKRSVSGARPSVCIPMFSDAGG